ncbi:MAG: AMP-binding protein [Actinobacteria bacterium]|nr:AMP-binding protein [Actinomycetota bacterium]
MEHASPFDGRPWVASYAAGVPADVEDPGETLPQMLMTSADRWGGRTALDFFGATTSYADLADAVLRGAEALRRLGIGPGDRVALMLPNCPQHVVAFYAVLRLGAVVVEHNPLYTADELQHQLADSGATTAICWDLKAPTLVALQDRTALERVVAVDLTTALPWRSRRALRLPLRRSREARAAMTGPVPAGVERWEHLVAAAGPLDPGHPQPGPDDTALLQYTTGTTGLPKGAVLSHRNLRVNAAQGRAWMPGLRDGEETVYAVLPLFHAYGLTLCLTFAMSIGATLVLFPRFDVPQVLAAMRRRPATFLPAVPPIYRRVAEAAAEQGVDLTSIRWAISGAMALPPDVVALWERATGGLLVEGYGMTETSPVALGNPAAPTRRPGTVGVPFPSTRIRVVDPDDATADRPAGAAGELLIHGPQVFGGYWNRPEESAAVLLPGGWLRTGDVVVVDEDGFVTVVDRIKELIVTGGFKVHPSEVEAVLRDVAGVADVAVVGVRGPEGEEVVAAVVTEPGAVVDVAEARAAARRHLAAYKVPRRVVLVDELPRSQLGKVLRRVVRERVEASEKAAAGQ